MENKNKPGIALIAPQVIGAKNQVRKATPPLGIGYLAAVLEERGYDRILVIDAAVEDYDHIVPLEDSPLFIKFGLSDDKIIERLKKFRPDIIGISSLFSSQTECAFSIARAIKRFFPKVPVVLGGNHASNFDVDIMEKENSIDFILAGEADYTFAEFVEKFFDGRDYLNTGGLAWREGAQIRRNPRPLFIKDLDALPFPAWHLFNMEEYFAIGMPHNPFVKSGRVGCVITSRGCPQNCYYCSTPDYFGRAFRPMSAKMVIEMIGRLVSGYAIKELQILDDTFTANYERVIDICEGIKHHKLRITLPNAIRADLPRDRGKRLAMFKCMRASGVEQIGIAAEHGDQDFLNNVICKKLDLQEVAATCDLAHEAGLLVHANFMMGFPFENAVNRQRTIEYAKKLDADSFSVSLTAPLPGTRLWDIVVRNGLFVDSFNPNRMVLAYVNIKPHDISPEELYGTVDKLNRQLNEAAQRKRPASVEKYKLFKGKSADGDRKYHFIEDEDKKETP